MYGLAGVAIANVNDAIRMARQEAGLDDLLFIAGSTFVVAEIENL
jgi:dihydrofolate synthase/folylpolyglutamate synthase